MKKVYIYCLIHSPKNFSKNSLEVPGKIFGPIYVIKYRDIAALVSQVKDRRFDVDKFKRWLEEDTLKAKSNILSHHKVIDWASRFGTVIPMKLGTVIGSEKNLKNLLKDFYPRFKKLLKNLDGRKEWGIKIYFDSGHFSSNAEADGHPEKADLPGQEEKIEEQLARAIETLRNNSENLIFNAPLPDSIDAQNREIIISSSVLVKEDCFRDFSQKIKKLKKELEPFGLDTELTGPWPPYSFTRMNNPPSK